jgi:hypothetical protein
MHILQKHEPKDDTRTARSFTTWHCRFGVLARSEKVLFQINAVLFDLFGKENMAVSSRAHVLTWPGFLIERRCSKVVTAID